VVELVVVVVVVVVVGVDVVVVVVAVVVVVVGVRDVIVVVVVVGVVVVVVVVVTVVVAVVAATVAGVVVWVHLEFVQTLFHVSELPVEPPFPSELHPLPAVAPAMTSSCVQRRNPLSAQSALASDQVFLLAVAQSLLSPAP